jgi:uncharacterized protein
MLILVASDAHGSSEAIVAVTERARNADLILFAGDLTDFGGEEDARSLLKLLGPARGKLAAVPGNCDKKGAREFLESEGLSAEGHLLRMAGAAIIGSGGSPRWTGITPYERGDKEVAASLFAASAELAFEGAKGLPLIVLTHAPPKGSGADLRKGAYIGSEALAEALERLAPVLWVCGHIHESPCAARVGRTLVLNPGSLRDGRYASASVERGPDGAWRAEAELKLL